MTIYVDDVGIPAEVYNPRSGKIVSSRWYHLISDQLDPTELHTFAARLGLHRSYSQEGKDILGQGPDPGHDHYDVTEGKRWHAIRLGATPVTGIELGRITITKTETYRQLAQKATEPAADAPSRVTERDERRGYVQ
jgi:hypothetical protein